LFAIRKIGQRKTLSGQRKTFSSQRKTLSGQRKTFSSQRKHFSVNGKHFLVNGNTFRIWFGFQESVFPFGCVYFPESDFLETTFQTFLCLFAIRKVGQRKTLSSQGKIWLGFHESVFLENLGGKHFPEVVKNLEMSLFADYIKSDSQTFD
jgi:hypothetical protein